MKALVIGGGIGGPVAAVALQAVGVEAAVYETRAAPADFRGLFLSLGVNGMRVLRQLGLLGAVLAQDTIATPDMEFCSTTGKRLGRVSNGWLDPETPSVTLMRGALQRALCDEASRRGIDVAYGKRYVDHVDTGDGVVARFADGSEARGDLVIGADGIHSRVRAHMLGGGPEPSYTGLLNVGGVAHAAGLDPTPDTLRMIWGRRAFFGYTIRGNGEAWWFANIGARGDAGRAPAREELAAVMTDSWQGQLLGLFADDPAVIAELIRHTDDIAGWPIEDMPSLPTWYRGRAVLLGDAAHAVSPSAGQGASLALEDALVLALCLRDERDARSLRDPGSLDRALARYQALRRPRAEKIVAAGRRRGAYKAVESRAVLWLRDRLMPLALRLFATDRSTAWIYDYEVPWTDPAADSPGG